jgi:hypothetical protein
MNYKKIISNTSKKNGLTSEKIKKKIKYSLLSKNLDNSIYYINEYLIKYKYTSLSKHLDNLVYYIIDIYCESINKLSTATLVLLGKIGIDILNNDIINNDNNNDDNIDDIKRRLFKMVKLVCDSSKGNNLETLKIVYNTSNINNELIEKYENIYKNIDILPENIAGIWDLFQTRDIPELYPLMDGFIYHLEQGSDRVYYYVFQILDLKRKRQKCSQRFRDWLPTGLNVTKAIGGRFHPEYVIWEYLFNITDRKDELYNILETLFYLYSNVTDNVNYLCLVVLYYIRSTDEVVTDEVVTDEVVTAVETLSKDDIDDFYSNNKLKSDVYINLESNLLIEKSGDDYFQLINLYKSTLDKVKQNRKNDSRKSKKKQSPENDIVTVELVEDPIPFII